MQALCENFASMIEVGQKIRLAREAMRPTWTQQELAMRMGVARSRVANWEANRAAPKPEFVEKIASLTGIAYEWFFDGLLTPIVSSKLSSITYFQQEPQADEIEDIPFDRLPLALQSLLRGDKVLLPLWRGTMASPSGECEFIEPETVEWTEVPAFLAGRDYMNCRACQVAGMSMAPRIQQGDRVIIRLDSNPPPNAIVAVERPTDRAKLLKVLRVKAGKLTLESVADGYGPIIELDGYVCLGVAVGIWATSPDGGRNIEWDDGRPLRA